ncbi:glycosyltransferase family 2 protein [Gleimia sp. 6138-11-ORH1]|uniref:glycosyltransferase family 2 protein n=1 Tax=Gleimia sp. 6138-11-ORH1 TaxID=2973937 RepID=UPI0021678AA5|nr:glycosyltransferase family 2 protein [Gleimia sp. 6138-11-ORH1]MCS4484044.1 glycosyltransferase family 2 protein [Gleimia sp. 6138-11-ORH1]
MKVAAVVVTFNRRDLLEKTLAGIEGLTRPVDKLFIIDNASTDDTVEFLTSRQYATEHRVIRTKVNTGGAGGFTLGIEEAYKEGYDAFWLMDDDTVPQPESLAELLKGMESYREVRGAYPSFACSSVLWTDGNLCEMNTPAPVWDWARSLAAGYDWVDVKSCSFVSCLVTREAVAAQGLPYREYFIWYDDAEYTTRLSKLRSGIYVPASKVDHLLAQNRGVNYGDVNEQNIWKFEYGVRNQVSAAWSLRRPTLLAEMSENMLKQMWGKKIPLSLKLRLLKAGAKGLFFQPRKRMVADK